MLLSFHQAIFLQGMTKNSNCVSMSDFPSCHEYFVCSLFVSVFPWWKSAMELRTVAMDPMRCPVLTALQETQLWRRWDIAPSPACGPPGLPGPSVTRPVDTVPEPGEGMCWLKPPGMVSHVLLATQHRDKLALPNPVLLTVCGHCGHPGAPAVRPALGPEKIPVLGKA